MASKVNPQAEELNQKIIKSNPAVFEMLSKRGKEIFFPKKGILSQGADAKGKEINTTIGMALEDDGTPMVLSDLNKMLNINNSKNAFTYAGSFGDPDLRKVWLEKILEANQGINKEQVSLPIVTNALTHGLSMCGYLFIDKGDTIISPDLYWENYRLIFSNAYGAKFKTFKAFKGQGFNTEAFEKTVLNHSASRLIILLNFPNNPTGYTPTVSEMNEIKSVLVKAASIGKKLVVLVDDAYFGLVYEEGIITSSPFKELCTAHSNILAVKLDAATKEDYVWGFRVGFISYGILNGNKDLYDALENKTAGAIRGSISNAPNLSQALLLNVYKSPDYKKEKNSKYETLKRRFLKVKEIFSSHSEFKEYFEPLPFNSGYFMCIRLKNLDSEKIRQLLLQKYSVGVIAEDKLLRIAFSATPFSKLEKLFDSIYRACCESESA